MVPYQVDWCLEQNATDCVVTTASEKYSDDNSGTMHKIWRLAKKYYPMDNKLTFTKWKASRENSEYIETCTTKQL